MMEFSAGMMDSHYHGSQDLLPHLYHPHPVMGAMPRQMSHFTQQVDYGIPNGTPPQHSMSAHQYRTPIHAQMFPDYSASATGFLMSLPSHSMNLPGFVPPHVPLDTNYRTNPGFIPPPPAHSGIVAMPAPISLSPAHTQKGMLPPAVSSGLTVTNQPTSRHTTPSPALLRSGSPRPPKQNSVVTPGGSSTATATSSRAGSTTTPATKSKVHKGPFSAVKLDVGDISPEAYAFNEEDKKFWCTKCNYATPRLDKVVQHVKAHMYSKWRCDECGKAFIKSCDMERHANSHAMGRTRQKAKGQITQAAGYNSSQGNTTVGASSQPAFPPAPQPEADQTTGRFSTDAGGTGSNGDAARTSTEECIIVQNDDGTHTKIMVHANNSVSENNNDSRHDDTPINGSVDSAMRSRAPSMGASNTSNNCEASDRLEVSTDEGKIVCVMSSEDNGKAGGRVDSRGGAAGSAPCVANGQVQIVRVDRGPHDEPDHTHTNNTGAGAPVETRAATMTEGGPTGLPVAPEGEQNHSRDRPGLSALRGLLQRSNTRLSPDTTTVNMASQEDNQLEVSIIPLQGQQHPPDAVPDDLPEDDQPGGQEDVPKLLPVLNPNATSSRQLCCNLCSYATKDMWHLEKHFLAHTRNYKTCKHCGKAFERPSDLVRHEERHLQRLGGDKSQISPPMPDELSPKISPPSRRVKISPVARRRPRIYYCDMCDKKFVAQQSLRFHKNSIHHSVVVRLDAYRTNVLLHTKLIQCEVGTNNQVTIHLSPPPGSELTKDETEVPTVSTVTDVFSIMMQARTPAPGQDHGALLAKANDILLQNAKMRAMKESGELVVNSGDSSPGGDGEGTQTMPQSVSPPVSQPVPLPQPQRQPQSQPLSQSVPQPLPQPLSQPLPQPLSQPLPQPLSQPLPQPLSQPLPQPLSQPVPQPLREPETQTFPDPGKTPGSDPGLVHPFIDGINKKGPIARRSLDGNYRCPKCNYSTNIKAKMEIHQKAHLGRYVCKLCGKAFVKTSDLTRHWVCHNTIPGSTFLSCDSCTFRTEDKQALENHMKEHYRVSAPRAIRQGHQGAGPGVAPPGGEQCNQAVADPQTQIT